MLQPVPAGEGGSVGGKPTSLVPGTQLGNTTDVDMDTDIRIERTGIVYQNVMDGHLGQSAIQNVPGLH